MISSKKYKTTAYNNLDGFPNHDAEYKKPDTEEWLLYDSTDINISKSQKWLYDSRKHLVAWGQVKVGRLTEKLQEGRCKCFHCWVGWRLYNLYVFIKTYQTAHLKSAFHCM